MILLNIVILGEVTGCGNLAIQYLIYNRPEAEPYANAALASLESHTSGTTNGAICFLLGYSYETGHGRGLDKTRARQLYEQGAALGEVKAMQSLAQMELTGEGGPSDKSAAARWLQKAVDAQDGPSCFYLANLYHLGDAVPQDEQRARALLEKACGLGVSSACDLLKASPK